MLDTVMGATAFEPVRIVIADDDLRLRSLLRAGLESDPRLRIVGEAANGLQALVAVTGKKPDVLLLDISMPTMDGWQVLEDLRQLRSDVRVVVHSALADDGVRRAALAAGAVDYLVKGSPPALIAERLVAANGRAQSFRSCA
jgi:CheY-like chemotaxis protein